MDRLLEEIWSDRSLAEKYLFERHIATSSMAVVVAARHLGLEERVVIKFLSPDAVRSSTAVSRFRSEAKAAAKIKSQHVVRIIDVATTANNVPYIVMEHLDGKDLEQLLEQCPHRRAPITDAVDFVLQASEAVCEGHSLGIVHRDLKPANLFCIDRGDGYPLVKVLDFGISKFTSARAEVDRTDRHEILGSPRYMSPEQIESASNVDHKSDIWSLGVILYEALAGKPPFDDELILGLWRKIKEDDPEPISVMRADVPPGLWEVITKCLDKTAAKRFADLGQLARALAPFAPERSRTCIGRILWLSENNEPPTFHTSLFAGCYDHVATNPPQRRLRWLLAGSLILSTGLGVGLFIARLVHERSGTRFSSLSTLHDSAMQILEPAPPAIDVGVAPAEVALVPLRLPKPAIARVPDSPSEKDSSTRLMKRVTAQREHSPRSQSDSGVPITQQEPDPVSSSASTDEDDNARTGIWLMPPVKERK